MFFDAFEAFYIIWKFQVVSPSQDIDVLAVLDFTNPCSHRETLGFLSQMFAHNVGRKLQSSDVHADFKDGNKGLKYLGLRGHRRSLPVIQKAYVLRSVYHIQYVIVMLIPWFTISELFPLIGYLSWPPIIIISFLVYNQTMMCSESGSKILEIKSFKNTSVRWTFL